MDSVHQKAQTDEARGGGSSINPPAARRTRPGGVADESVLVGSPLAERKPTG